MRRNQYSSEKRRKELDRKKKQEEKRQKKLERRAQGPEEGGAVLGADGAPAAVSEGASPDQTPAADDAPQAAPPQVEGQGGQDSSSR